MKRIGKIQTTALFLLFGIAGPAYAWQEKPEKQEEKPKPAKQEQRAKPEKRQEAKAPKQEQRAKPEKQQEARAPKPEQAKPEKQQQAKAQQQKERQQQDNSAKQEQRGQAKAQQEQQRQQRENSAKQQQQAKAQQDHQHQQRQQQDNRSAQHRSPAEVHVQQVAWQGDRARSWQSEHRNWQQRGGYNGYRVPDDRFRTYYGQDHGFRIFSLPVIEVGGRRRFQYGGYWFGLVDPWPEYWDTDWYDNDDVYVDYYGDGYYLHNRQYPNDRIAISFYLN